MPAQTKRRLVIRDAEKLRALRTPLRREIIEALLRLGSASVKDVAAELERAPAALYYHVHELERVGLIREVEKRSAGKRHEIVYGPVAPKVEIDRTVRKPSFVEALTDLQRSTLRTAEREMARALEGPRAGRAEAASLIRLTARLKPRAARQARRKLRELARFLAENDDPKAADTYALTAALVPVTRGTSSS
jgi:predicted transcriptional regulator